MEPKREREKVKKRAVERQKEGCKIVKKRAANSQNKAVHKEEKESCPKHEKMGEN